MHQKRKIAMVGREWVGVYARLLAGGLDYASAHPRVRVFIRPFTKSAPAATVVAELERWGAEAIFGSFSDARLQALKAALSRPIPIVNNSISADYPGVFHVVVHAGTFVDKGTDHLRLLGLKYFGLLLTNPTPGFNERLLPSFKRATEPHTSVHIEPISEDQLLQPEWNTLPVPESLATWLREMPKPCGVLAPCLGSARFLVGCCDKLGLKVPEEIAIIGTDDADVCLSCTPTLTSITPNMEIMGSESTRLLLGILDGAAPPKPTIQVTAVDLVVRESTGQQRPAISDIAGALEYIKANATKGLSVTHLMHETQRTSQPTFYQGFYKATGKTPAQAIRDRQLEEAKRLLTTTQLPVGMISEMSGFSRSNVMARVFRQQVGMAPLDYRKQSTKA